MSAAMAGLGEILLRSQQSPDGADSDAVVDSSSSNSSSKSPPPPSRAQLAAELAHANHALDSNLAAPVQRELAAIAAAQAKIVDGTERLARDTQAVVAGLMRSAATVEAFTSQYQRMDSFDQWLQSSVTKAAHVAESLRAAHELLQE